MIPPIAHLVLIPFALLQAPYLVLAQEVQGKAPQALNISIINGDRARNNIRHGISQAPVARITDENDKPIAGVSITFTVLQGPTGAGADFPIEGELITREDGTVTLRNGRANANSGQFKIRIDAKLEVEGGRQLHASAILTQTNRALVLGILPAAQAIPLFGAAITAAGLGIRSAVSGPGSPVPVVSQAPPSATIGSGGSASVGPPR